jgi:hypothetical protein
VSRIARFFITPWEKLYSKFAHEQPVIGGSGVGAFSRHPHRGETVILSDGTEVNDGDPITELHLINYKLRDVVHSASGDGVNEFGLLIGEYKAMARMAKTGQIDDFKAVFGMTRLGPIVKRLGFEVFPAEDTRANRAIAAWQDFLRRVYYPTGEARRNNRPLVVYWMPKQTLIEKFGD